VPAEHRKITLMDRWVALAYATVAVLGFFVVVLTLSLYLPGLDRGTLPVP